MNNREDLTRGVRTAVALILVAMYAAGLVAMLASQVRLALILWVVSTLGGIGMLYWLHTVKKRSDASAGDDPGSSTREDP